MSANENDDNYQKVQDGPIRKQKKNIFFRIPFMVFIYLYPIDEKIAWTS